MRVCLFPICFLLVRFVLVHGSADPEDFRKMTAVFRKKCLAEIKIPVEMVEDSEYGEFPEDERLKCYFSCALQKSSMMDKKGNIKYNQLKLIIPEAYKEVGNEMIDSCIHIDSKDKCQKAFDFMKCMYNVNPMAFVAP
ncbi:general odorant-binding protein 83a-like isoform X2 [Ceratina calcarata]|uniref:General odorant-binding protein 83a-like isoform X2 n=1 Tax=Ceratina calcarata TaxID=156304 RepID=A0AAJ7NF08_9HYME|nr:general odorant-binding protein 83a-like isoform X2 [Ceratina calcarata]